MGFASEYFEIELPQVWVRLQSLYITGLTYELHSLHNGLEANSGLDETGCKASSKFHIQYEKNSTVR